MATNAASAAPWQQVLELAYRVRIRLEQRQANACRRDSEWSLGQTGSACVRCPARLVTLAPPTHGTELLCFGALFWPLVCKRCAVQTALVATLPVSLQPLQLDDRYYVKLLLPHFQGLPQCLRQ